MHLLLIRHGETDWNHERRIQGNTDTPLNARGIAQAEQLATRIAAEKIDALYTSPLVRARATAEIIGQKCGRAPNLDERLREKGVGDLESLTIAEVEQRYPDLIRLWQVSPDHVPLPNEETPAQVQQRVQTFVADLRERYANGARVGVVSHGGTLGLLIATLIGWDISKRLPFWFDNASVSLIDLAAARPRVRLLNDTCHLANGK
jgi:broad specificity phosphatase PhoE